MAKKGGKKKVVEQSLDISIGEMDDRSVAEKIDKDIKLGEIISWGSENLPAGPDVENNSDLIIVEGRADVLNLLRIGVKNTIAVQNKHLPKGDV